MTFCKFMQEVLDGVPNVYCYLDDLVIFTEDEETHLKIVEQVFQRLEKYGLALSLSKCAFAQEEVEHKLLSAKKLCFQNCVHLHCVEVNGSQINSLILQG